MASATAPRTASGARAASRPPPRGLGRTRRRASVRRAMGRSPVRSLREARQEDARGETRRRGTLSTRNPRPRRAYLYARTDRFRFRASLRPPRRGGENAPSRSRASPATSSDGRSSRSRTRFPPTGANTTRSRRRCARGRSSRRRKGGDEKRRFRRRDDRFRNDRFRVVVVILRPKARLATLPVAVRRRRGKRTTFRPRRNTRAKTNRDERSRYATTTDGCFSRRRRVANRSRLRVFSASFGDGFFNRGKNAPRAAALPSSATYTHVDPTSALAASSRDLRGRRQHALHRLGRERRDLDGAAERRRETPKCATSCFRANSSRSEAAIFAGSAARSTCANSATAMPRDACSANAIDTSPDTQLRSAPGVRTTPPPVVGSVVFRVSATVRNRLGDVITSCFARGASCETPLLGRRDARRVLRGSALGRVLRVFRSPSILPGKVLHVRPDREQQPGELHGAERPTRRAGGCPVAVRAPLAGQTEVVGERAREETRAAARREHDDAVHRVPLCALVTIESGRADRVSRTPAHVSGAREMSAPRSTRFVVTRGHRDFSPSSRTPETDCGASTPDRLRTGRASRAAMLRLALRPTAPLLAAARLRLRAGARDARARDRDGRVDEKRRRRGYRRRRREVHAPRAARGDARGACPGGPRGCRAGRARDRHGARVAPQLALREEDPTAHAELKCIREGAKSSGRAKAGGDDAVRDARAVPDVRRRHVERALGAVVWGAPNPLIARTAAGST